MGDITRNISRYEMECECGCGFNTCDKVLADSLQLIVDHFTVVYEAQGKVYLEITGPNRCLFHNEQVQASYFLSKGKLYKPYSSKSTHIYGIAADFKLYIKLHSGKRVLIPAVEVFAYMDNTWPDTFGMGIYYNRCHLDVRLEKSRWNG